jgi:arginase family enzyme
MYWLLEEGHIKGENFIQIGQRQWDEQEIRNVRRFGTTLCEGWKFGYEKNNWHSLSVSKKVHGRTTERNVAITFDIDAYDAALLRCTGTPEPWGLDFPQVNRILQNINPTAKLVYFDMVEVGHDPRADPSFIEGGLAAQTILHMLCQPYVKQIFK